MRQGNSGHSARMAKRKVEGGGGGGGGGGGDADCKFGHVLLFAYSGFMYKSNI